MTEISEKSKTLEKVFVHTVPSDQTIRSTLSGKKGEPSAVLGVDWSVKRWNILVERHTTVTYYCLCFFFIIYSFPVL